MQFDLMQNFFPTFSHALWILRFSYSNFLIQNIQNCTIWMHCELSKTQFPMNVIALFALLNGSYSKKILREWRHMPFNWKHLSTVCNCFVHFTNSSSRIFEANIQPFIQLCSWHSCMLQNSLDLMWKNRKWKYLNISFSWKFRNKSFSL